MKIATVVLALVSLFTLAVTTAATSNEARTLQSVHVPGNMALQADPGSPLWRQARPVYMEKDRFGKAVPGYRTEVRSVWTDDNIYFLFVCPYEELYLKPSPDVVHETNQLWNWDVAEVFIGSDFKNIRRYKEFEVSPQGEWIDLDINLDSPHHEDGWVWNSGFQAAVRVDPAARIWYAALRIPLAAIESHAATPGDRFRVNLFRSQGPPAREKEITWQPPMAETFHTPERFGLLELVK
jgi:hypothetical protein